MEFLLNFLCYLYNYYMICALFFLWFPCDLVMCCHLTVTHNPVTLVTLSHMILSHAPSLCSKSRKEKKGKNNNLVVLPSHDTL